jgi:hypothetical protein
VTYQQPFENSSVNPPKRNTPSQTRKVVHCAAIVRLSLQAYTNYNHMLAINKALQSKRESKRIEFKESIDVSSTGDWCELIKDICALANSGGGIILVGVNNDGTVSRWNPTSLLAFDQAKVVDKIASYTGRQFDQFDVAEAVKNNQQVAVISIGAVDIPIVFQESGAYTAVDGKQKIAFGKGTLYFRHGAKSEPARYEDIVNAINRVVENRRKIWFKGIRRVIEAEPGDTLQIVRPPATGTEPVLRGRIVGDKDAIPVRPAEADSSWPYRRGEVVKMVNSKLTDQSKITPYDVQAVRGQFYIDSKHPEFMYKPFKIGSPQYSVAFVEWLLSEYKKDPSFFRKARQFVKDNS